MEEEPILKIISHKFLELAHSYIADSQSSPNFHTFYRNLSSNKYGLSEGEFWLMFSRGFQSTSGFVISDCCSRRMDLRDLSWHKCQNNRGGDEKVVLNRFKIILRSLKLTKQSIIFTILVLKRLLGRDLAVKIVKILYETRYDFCLWYRPIQTFPNKRKVKTKKRMKRLKDPKDFRWVL